MHDDVAGADFLGEFHNSMFQVEAAQCGRGTGCGWKTRPPVLRMSDTDTWHGCTTDARLQSQALQNLLILPYRIGLRRMDATLSAGFMVRHMRQQLAGQVLLRQQTASGGLHTGLPLRQILLRQRGQCR